eukprot:gene44780-55723_t
MPLDQMLAGYQRGAVLLAFCRKRLDAVQDQIKVLDEGSLQAWGAWSRPCRAGWGRVPRPGWAMPCATPCWTAANACVRCW